MRLASKYKNNIVASKKKHIFSRLLDYFSLFVVTYLLFTVFYAIASRTPFIGNKAEALREQNIEIAEYIDSTHLQRLNEEGNSLLTIDDGAAKYVERLCKTSAYVHDLTFPVKNEQKTFDEVVISVEETFVNDTTNYALDDASYYFKVFKKNETSLNSYLYEEIDYKDDIDAYQYLKIMQLDASKYITSDNEALLAKGNGVSCYVVLTKENTITLLRFFKEDRADTSLYNEIYLSFINAAKYGIKDVENNSVIYKDYIDAFNNCYQSLSLAIFVVYLITYVISYVALNVIVALISKEWITLGQKVMGLTMASYDEFEPSVYQLIGYHALTFILFSTSMVIAFYFIGIFGVLSFKLFGVISLFAISGGLFIFDFVSLFMPFFNKHSHDFASFITRIYVKDTKEFEGPVGTDDLPQIEENNNGRSNEQ